MSDKAVEALQELYRMVTAQAVYLHLEGSPEMPVGRVQLLQRDMRHLHAEIRRLYHLHAALVGHL